MDFFALEGSVDTSLLSLRELRSVPIAWEPMGTISKRGESSLHSPIVVFVSL